MSNSLNLLDALDCSEAFDECFEFSDIVNHDDEIPSEQAVVRVDVDATQHEFLFL